ncbi:MAG: hypothetical protein BJ554DRAFT_4678, partial [Olpidium bornovanus]
MHPSSTTVQAWCNGRDVQIAISVTRTCTWLSSGEFRCRSCRNGHRVCFGHAPTTILFVDRSL